MVVNWRGESKKPSLKVKAYFFKGTQLPLRNPFMHMLKIQTYTMRMREKLRQLKDIKTLYITSSSNLNSEILPTMPVNIIPSQLSLTITVQSSFNESHIK